MNLFKINDRDYILAKDLSDAVRTFNIIYQHTTLRSLVRIDGHIELSTQVIKELKDGERQ